MREKQRERERNKKVREGEVTVSVLYLLKSSAASSRVLCFPVLHKKYIKFSEKAKSFCLPILSSLSSLPKLQNLQY